MIFEGLSAFPLTPIGAVMLSQADSSSGPLDLLPGLLVLGAVGLILITRTKEGRSCVR